MNTAMLDVDTRTHYSDEELVAFFTRCHRFALRCRLSHETAQDFSSWALIKIMEGRATNPKWLLTDFYREHENHGRARSINYEERVEVNSPKIRLDQPVREDSDATLHEIVPAPEPEEHDVDLVEIEETAYWNCKPKVRQMVDMVRCGKNQNDIAMVFGVTAGRISQVMASWKLEIAKAHVAKLREAAPEAVSVDTRIEVQWLTI